MEISIIDVLSGKRCKEEKNRGNMYLSNRNRVSFGVYNVCIIALNNLILDQLNSSFSRRNCYLLYLFYFLTLFSIKNSLCAKGLEDMES